jgi:hypothetical protein
MNVFKFLMIDLTSYIYIYIYIYIYYIGFSPGVLKTELNAGDEMDVSVDYSVVMFQNHQKLKNIPNFLI